MRPQDIDRGEVPWHLQATQEQKVKKRAGSHSNDKQHNCRRDRVPITRGTYRKDFLKNCSTNLIIIPCSTLL